MIWKSQAGEHNALQQRKLLFEASILFGAHIPPIKCLV